MRARWPLVLGAASVAAFCGVLAAAYAVDPVQRRDARLLARLYARRETWLGEVATVVVHLGDPAAQLVLLGLLLALGARSGRRREALAATVLVLGANLTTQVLKGVLSHPRFQPLLGYNQVAVDAFPSGHATAMAAMTYAYLLVLPRRWRPAAAGVGAVATVCVGTASVVLHNHYPSDVVGGVLVATAWFSAVLAARRHRCPPAPADGRPLD